MPKIDEIHITIGKSEKVYGEETIDSLIGFNLKKLTLNMKISKAAYQKISQFKGLEELSIIYPNDTDNQEADKLIGDLIDSLPGLNKITLCPNSSKSIDLTAKNQLFEQKIKQKIKQREAHSNQLPKDATIEPVRSMTLSKKKDIESFLNTIENSLNSVEEIILEHDIKGNQLDKLINLIKKAKVLKSVRINVINFTDEESIIETLVSKKEP